MNFTTAGKAILLLILSLGCSQTYSQQTDFWDAQGTAFFHFTTSWQDGSPPTVNDHAVFNQANTYTARWNNATGNTFSRSIQIQNGDVTFLGSFTDVVHTVLDELTVDNDASLEITTHNLNVQDGTDVSGSLEMAGDSNLTTEGMSVAPLAADNANFEISGSDAELFVNGFLSIGQFGDANFMANNGAVVDVDGNFRVGFQGQGFVLFQDAGTVLNVRPQAPIAGQIVVGGNGFGTVDFFGGASGTTEELLVTTNGIVSVTGADSNLTTNVTEISGPAGAVPATVNLFSGGQLLSNGSAVLANSIGSVGAVQIGNSGASWTLDGLIDIGQLGMGSISVADGGRLQSNNGISQLGQEAGGSGLVTVSGAGTLAILDNLDVGLNGDGELRIESGGRMESTDCFVGLSSGDGVVTVTGVGSELLTGDLRIGDQTRVLDGASVLCSEVNVLSGVLEISDDGTSLTQVGSASCDITDGVVSINDGAELICDRVNLIDQATLEMNGDGCRLQANGGIAIDFGNLIVSGSQQEINGGIDNSGVLRKQGIGGLSIFGDLMIDEFDGELRVEAGSSIAVHGDFQANEVIGTGSMFLLGTFDPHDNDFGDVVFEGSLQLRPSSTTAIQIGGANTGEFDRILVENNLQLQDGTLNVELADGFVPAPLDEFVIAEGGSVTGTFGGLVDGDVVATVGNIALRIFYSDNEVKLIAEDKSREIIGDVNGDGIVNLLDVGPFVAVLSGGVFQVEADINQDGVVDLLDVSPFVELLSGG